MGGTAAAVMTETEKVEAEIATVREQIKGAQAARDLASARRAAAVAANDPDDARHATAESKSAVDTLLYLDERIVHLTEIALPAAEKLDRAAELPRLIEQRTKLAREQAKQAPRAL